MTLEEIRLRLLGEMRWSENDLALVLRARGRCEYCDRDIFSSLDVYYFERDHIIPKGRGSDDINNIAIACYTCNYLKRRWDPTNVKGISASREELIQVSREYISRKRQEKEAFVRKHESLFREYLRLSASQ